MELLGDEAQMEARFGPFGDSANLDEVHGLCQTNHRLRNRFGRIRWNSEVTWAMWNFVSVYLETVLVSVQDSWMVRAKCTIRSEIEARKLFWMHPIVLRGDEAQVEARLSLFADSANLDAI
jgi:hypothetical protein